MSSYSNAKIIFGLNTLIKLNDKRIRYYKLALEKSDDVDLILWFNRYASHLQNANEILVKWLNNCGSLRPATARELVSHWDQIKDMFVLGRRGSLLSHCEALERNALKVYRAAIALHFVPSIAIQDIQEQLEDIERALESLHTLNDNQSQELQVA